MNEIIAASEDLMKRVERVWKFQSKYGVIPITGITPMVYEMDNLAKSIPSIKRPQNIDEVITSELKRRLEGDSFCLGEWLNPDNSETDAILAIYGIPKRDVSNLKKVLEKNKKRTEKAIDRLFKTKNITEYTMGASTDVPDVRDLAESIAKLKIEKYHIKIGELLQELTPAGDYLREIKAVPTTNPRSYYNVVQKRLAIGIPSICFSTEDGSIDISEKELIRIYGHEGMGHALNRVMTMNAKLPYFLSNGSALTSSTDESVAQFYQQVIFEDLKNSPKTQKDLGISHIFEEIYQDSKDISLIGDYQLKLSQYAISVLADKSLGDPSDTKTIKKKIELISEVSLDPRYARSFVESHRNSYDSDGNFNPSMVAELRYCAQPVQRALAEFKKHGITYDNNRGLIDQTFLTGVWTPKGFVDNARIKAQESSNKGK
jgi:hypothetical protein